MTIEGADVAELHSAAQQLDRGAAQLETAIAALGRLLDGTAWRGPDADRFRSQWSGCARATSGAVDALRRGATDLRRNADEQDRASTVDPADGDAARLYTADSTKSGAAGMFATLHDMNGGKKSADGVLVQKVVDADGNERLVVYLNGTGASDHMTAGENFDAALNPTVDKEILARIDKALRDAGYDPDDKSSQPPIMLVGYSQGGMDAEKIAAMNHYNVTTLVTYGAPLVVADQPGITTVHLRAVGDNIPNVPAEILAAPNLISNPAVGIAQEVALRNGWSVGVPGNTLPLTDPLSGPSQNIYTADPHVPDATDGTGSYAGNHGVEKTYLTVGSDFDKSDDPALAAKQQAIAAFQGRVVKEWQPGPSVNK